MPTEHVYKQLTQPETGNELSAKLLRKVTRLDRRIALLQSIRVQPDPALMRAVFAIESSAWRGKAAKHARALLALTSQYVAERSSAGVFIGNGAAHATYHVTFGGKTSSVPVAISNDLPYKVRVGLKVKTTNAKVSGEPDSITDSGVQHLLDQAERAGRVEPGQDPAEPDRAAALPAGGQPLPAHPEIVLVHPTDFGTVALVICAAVLALFVIGSAVRAIRSGRAEPGPPHPPRRVGPDGSAEPRAARQTRRDRPDAAGTRARGRAAAWNRLRSSRPAGTASPGRLAELAVWPRRAARRRGKRWRVTAGTPSKVS